MLFFWLVILLMTAFLPTDTVQVALTLPVLSLTVITALPSLSAVIFPYLLTLTALLSELAHLIVI